MVPVFCDPTPTTSKWSSIFRFITIQVFTRDSTISWYLVIFELQHIYSDIGRKYLTNLNRCLHPSMTYPCSQVNIDMNSCLYHLHTVHCYSQLLNNHLHSHHSEPLKIKITVWVVLPVKGEQLQCRQNESNLLSYDPLSA